MTEKIEDECEATLTQELKKKKCTHRKHLSNLLINFCIQIIEQYFYPFNILLLCPSINPVPCRNLKSTKKKNNVINVVMEGDNGCSVPRWSMYTKAALLFQGTGVLKTRISHWLEVIIISLAGTVFHRELVLPQNYSCKMQITESYQQWLCSDSVVEDRALMKHQWMGEELRPQRRFSSDV